MAVDAVKKPKTNIKRMRKLFRGLSVIAKIIFVPVLIFSCMVVITYTTTKNFFNVPSAFGYSIVTLGEGENQTTIYAKNTDPAQIQKGQEVVFFNVIKEDPVNPEFTIEKLIFQSLEFNEGNAEIRLDGAEYLIPANNLIGVEVEEIPFFAKFFISNFSTATSMLLAAILPIVILASVFIFDTLLYFKDKQEANKNLAFKVIKNETLTAQEQVNLSNFEAVKASIIGANKKDEIETEGKKEEPVIPSKPAFEPKAAFGTKPVPPAPMPKGLPPKVQGVNPNIKVAPNAENAHLGKAKPPIIPKKPDVPQPPEPPVLPPRKPE